MKVLVACERSQAVLNELLLLGHDAYSCDILPCIGGMAERHYMCDVIDLLDDGWDMMLAFPPCTHLACSGARWFPEKIADGRQQQGIDFFMALINCDIPKIAIENPVGIMSTIYRKPDQIIQPYFFGDEARKTTCLWLKGLPLLTKTKVVGQGEDVIHGGKKFQKWYSNKTRDRDITFPGIAKAMAEQWV